jgi:hypothetical protein
MKEKEDKNAEQDKTPNKPEVTADKQITEKSEEEIREEIVLQKFRKFLSFIDSDDLINITEMYLNLDEELIEILDIGLSIDLKEEILEIYGNVYSIP